MNEDTLTLTPEQRGELLMLVSREMGNLQDDLSRNRLQHARTPADTALATWIARLDKRLAFLTEVRHTLVRSLMAETEEAGA